MKTLSLFILLLIPALGFSQTSNVFIKLTDPKGVLIKGDGAQKGFEKTIRAWTTASSGKNNTQFTFTMNVMDAAAILKNAMANGDQLMNATVSVMTATGPSYTITMEKIRVVACAESMGCNSVMTTEVSLQATRIGWTYYAADRSGMNMVVSQKYGFDAETGQAWNKF